MSENICNETSQTAEVLAKEETKNGMEDNNSTQKEQPKVSKGALRRARREAKWNANKAERRKREKAKQKEKRAKLKELGITVDPRRVRKDQLIKQADSPCKVAVVIDCDFADYMTEMELKKLCKQLNWCYSVNKRSSKPVQLYFTSVTGVVKSMMDRQQEGYQNWDTIITEKHWREVFNHQKPEKSKEESIESTESTEKLNPNQKIVYLSGDSPHCLDDCTTIQAANEGVFIIGGLIDHNRHKGLTLERAQAVGVAHARLPIIEHIRMTQRLILAIPHVFEIMMYAANGTLGTDWTDILQKVIPARKKATPIDKKEKEEDVKAKED